MDRKRLTQRFGKLKMEKNQRKAPEFSGGGKETMEQHSERGMNQSAKFILAAGVFCASMSSIFFKFMSDNNGCCCPDKWILM